MYDWLVPFGGPFKGKEAENSVRDTQLIKRLADCFLSRHRLDNLRGGRSDCSRSVSYRSTSLRGSRLPLGGLSLLGGLDRTLSLSLCLRLLVLLRLIDHREHFWSDLHLEGLLDHGSSVVF